MVETEKKIQVIHCQHKTDGRTCQNIICVREGDVVTVKRHGREIKAIATDFFPIIIVCERCGSPTRIFCEK